MTNQTIGSYLKDLRLRKGYSLEKVSMETKISLSILKKLELNELSTLPNITYVKGYVQNILKTLHTPFTQYEIDLIQSTYIALGIIKEERARSVSDNTKQPITTSHNDLIKKDKSPGQIYNLASLKSKRIILSVLSLLIIIGIFKFVQKINKQPDLRQSQVKTHSKNEEKLKPIESLTTVITNPPALPNVTSTASAPETVVSPTPTATNVQFPKFEFKKVSNLAISIDVNAEDNSNTILYPENDRKKIVSGKQNIYVAKIEGESWISYKKDQDPPKSTLLKAGQKFFLSGDKVFLTIGNTTNVKVFYNGQLVQFVDNKGVKSFIFPLNDAAEHSLPLFVRDSNDKLYFYQDYIPLMNQESTSGSL